ncbi:MAG: tetratricopeptide repeat protein [Candidatus Krumholzibacteriia bacterium]
MRALFLPIAVAVFLAGPARPVAGAPPVVQAGSLDLAAELRTIDAWLDAGEAAAALQRSSALLAAPDLDPRNRWRVRQREAAALIALGRPGEAVDILESVLQDADEPTLHVNLARALVALGQRGRAIAEYQLAVLADASDPAWHLEYADVLRDLGALRDAAREIAEARRLCGDCPPALRADANLALSRGDHLAAIAPLQALLERGGGPEIRALLVASLWNGGQTDTLAAVLDTVATSDLSPAEMLVLVQLERRRQRAERVLAWVRHPERELPTGWQPSADFWALSGEVCLGADAAAEALLAFDRAIALQPRAALYHHNRAAALVRLGRDREAREALDEARRLDPDLGRTP